MSLIMTLLETSGRPSDRTCTVLTHTSTSVRAKIQDGNTVLSEQYNTTWYVQCSTKLLSTFVTVLTLWWEQHPCSRAIRLF